MRKICFISVSEVEQLKLQRMCVCERESVCNRESASYKYLHYSTLSKNTAAHTILEEMLIDGDGGPAQNRAAHTGDGRDLTSTTHTHQQQITRHTPLPLTICVINIHSYNANFLPSSSPTDSTMCFKYIFNTMQTWAQRYFLVKSSKPHAQALFIPPIIHAADRGRSCPMCQQA